MPSKSTQISTSSQSALGVPMLVTAMLLLTSMHFIFAALLKPYLTPSLSVFYILSTATVEVGVYLSFRGGIRFDVFNQNRWFFIILGAAIAISTNLNYLDLGSFFFFRLLLTAIWMFSIHAVFSLSSNQAILVLPSWPGGFMILLVASIEVGISRALYYAALRRLPLSIHTLVLTLAPALTICWSYLLFNHPPHIQQLVGGVGIMGSVMLVTWRRG